MSFPARLGLLLALLPAAVPAEEEKARDGDAFAVVDELLAADGLDRSALSIRDRAHLRGRAKHAALFPDPQSHLLPAVRTALDDPLAQPARLEAAAARAWDGEGVAACQRELDRLRGAPESSEVIERAVTGFAIEGLTVEEAHPLRELAAEVAVLGKAVDAFLAPLSEDERAHLRTWLPRWVSRTKPEEADELKKGEEDEAERSALQRCAALLAKTDAAALRRAWREALFMVQHRLPGLRALRGKLADRREPVRAGGLALYGSGRQRIELSAPPVVDLGGSDEYRLPADAPRRPVQIVIDLGGDDLYLAQGPFAWGAALLGCSLHVDLAGDDDYRGRDWSLGCGVAGHGALWDLAGRDRYYGGLGTQGAGIFGTGLLLDDAGADEYVAGLFAQGFGSSGGAGALVDRGGDDAYLAGRDEEDVWRRPGTFVTFAQGAAYGHRFGHVYRDDSGKRRWKITGQIPGGVGLLLDRAGDDRYEADVFGQGAGYWYGLGAVVDGGGHDRYRATWYGQGVGTHAAVGVVVDRGGNDWYFSRNTSQGCGHDFSAGLLVDRAGDDEYAGLTLCQGAGNAASGLGVLLDEAGDDRYRCGARCWGFGSAFEVEALRPFGLFLDRGGDNTYAGWPRGAARPAARWKHSPRGYGVDGR